jgi:hypothetical protein
MLNDILTSPDGWTVLKVVAILVPVLVLFWIIMTVMALHKRDVYFWNLIWRCARPVFGVRTLMDIGSSDRKSVIQGWLHANATIAVRHLFSSA